MRALMILAVLLISTAALAGGVVPQGMGLFQDGRMWDYVPASSNTIRWTSYGASQTTRARDEVSWAVASVDYETRDFRLLYGGDASPAPAVMAFFSFKSDPVPPQCFDNIEGNCLLAMTECLTDTKQGNFKLCSAYRINVYVPTIEWAFPGDPFEDHLHAILRHELGHLLGLAHDGQGPMTNGNLPFSQCQLGKWRLFSVDPNVATWSYPQVPECQAQRAAFSDGSCPNGI